MAQDDDKTKAEFELRAVSAERKLKGTKVSYSDLSDADLETWVRVRKVVKVLGTGCTEDPCNPPGEDESTPGG
jgi:hypothetical protein